MGIRRAGICYASAIIKAKALALRVGPANAAAQYCGPSNNGVAYTRFRAGAASPAKGVCSKCLGSCLGFIRGKRE